MLRLKLNIRSSDGEEHRKLRRQGGNWLKQLREDVGLSQRELAEKLDVEYHTLISQLESGIGRVPTHRYRDWSRVLQIPLETFVRELLRYYDPDTYEILLSDGEAARNAKMGGKPRA
jgi:transcriptional regulator with XRE-family HTH domain